jgi:predicted nucleic acid-binding protein
MSFWDALLWATADRIGVRYLLTEDYQDGRTLGGVTFVDPFKDENEQFLAEILPSP